MTNTEFNSLLEICIIPRVIDLIMKFDNINTIDAIKLFYNSKVYEALCQEELKVWHYSALAIFDILQNEIKTGKLIYPY